MCYYTDSLSARSPLSRSSGLFVKQGFGRGLSLQHSTFTVLVLPAIQLTISGFEDEDLLGI
jgi:hypothetical protein